MFLLRPGERFPSVVVHPAGGDPVTVPDAVAGHYAVILFYRGAWCPDCRAQLASFQRAHDRLAALDARVVALSVDDEATTVELVHRLGLGFPVGHDADPEALNQATGAPVHRDPAYLESTGFVLDPAGDVVVGVYSGEPAGRLDPDDVTQLIRGHRPPTADP